MRLAPPVPVTESYRPVIHVSLDSAQYGHDIRLVTVDDVIEVAREATVRLTRLAVPPSARDGATLRHIPAAAKGNPAGTIFDLEYRHGVWHLTVVFRGVMPRVTPWRPFRTDTIHLTNGTVIASPLDTRTAA